MIMSTTRIIERRIIQQILHRRHDSGQKSVVEGLIITVSVLACMSVLAAFHPGMLWLLLTGAFVFILGG